MIRNFYNFLLNKNVFIYLLTFFTLIIGTFSALTIMREAYPKVDFGTITITTVYQGASPEEVEKFVTNEIEKNVKDITGIDTIESLSAESRSSIVITLFPGEDQDAILSDVNSAIGRTSFPKAVEDPITMVIDSGSFPIITLSLTGAHNYSELRKLAKQLDDRLIQLDGISQITRTNYRIQEYRVKVNPTLLRKYYVSLRDVIHTIAQRSINMPGGKIETPDSEKAIRSLGEFSEFGEVENVVLRSNDAGKLVRIKDVATVENSFEDPRILSRINGQESIDLTITKKSGVDIVTTIREIHKICAEFEHEHQKSNIKITSTNDLSKEIEQRLDILYNNAISGTIIVLISLFLFLNFKIALLVSLSVPVSVLGSLPIIKSLGITVNLVSLLGFILVIGIVVDNATVVCENIFVKHENGLDPKEATIVGTAEVVKPIVFSTLTAIAAFCPLLVMGGIIGKFVWSIPVVVILSVLASLIYAILILPNMINVTLRGMKRPSKTAKKNSFFKKTLGHYESMMKVLINWRYIVAPVFVLLLIASLVFAGLKMDFILFPNEDARQFNIRFEGPTDIPLEKLSTQMKQMETLVQKLPKTEMENYMTSVGRITDGGFGIQMSSNIGEIIVLLTPEDSRDRKARDIVQQLREEAKKLNLPNLKITFEVQQNGPPVGKPVKVDILGEDFTEINTAAADIQKLLKTMPGLTDVDTSFRIGKPEVRIKLDETKSAQSRLSMMDIASEVQAAMGGTIATELRKSDEEIDIRVIYNDDYRRAESDLRSLQIPNTYHQLVDITSVAEFSQDEGLSDITHFDRKRVVSITSDVNPALTNSMKANQAITKPLKELNKKFPHLHFLQRGENEDSQESIRNLFIAFGFALFLIFMIIASMFNSFIEPLIIMLAIPFGIIGVIIAFYFHGAPISFMMLMGVIGLSGVVVNNTIILVDVIVEFRAKGMSNIESIIEGGKARFRAVFLTSITTLVGLIPTAYGIGGSDAFIIPLCLSLGWGVLFSTTLTLLLLPCTYAIFDDLRTFLKK